MIKFCYPKIKIFGRSSKRKGPKTMARALSYRVGKPIKELSGRSAGGERKSQEKKAPYYTLFPPSALRFMDLQVFADTVDRSENRHDSQFSIEVMLPIPEYFDQEQRKDVVIELRRIFMAMGEYGVMVIHNLNKDNPHIHAVISHRPIEENGNLAEKKESYFSNKKKRFANLRIACQDAINKVLEDNNFPERADFRSYEKQGLFILPTKHVNPYFESVYGDRNKKHNGAVEEFNADYTEALTEILIKSETERYETFYAIDEENTKSAVTPPQIINNTPVKHIQPTAAVEKKPEKSPPVQKNTTKPAILQKLSSQESYEIIRNRRQRKKRRFARNASQNRSLGESHSKTSR